MISLRHLLLLVLFVAFASPAHAAGSWVRAYSGTPPQAIAATRDGGAILTSGGTVVRIDAAGEIVWSRWIQSSPNLGAEIDGGIILVSNGFTQRERFECFITRVDERGAVVWHRRLDAPFEAQIAAIAAAPGGGFVVTGSDPSERNAIFVARFGGDGKRAWARAFDIRGSERLGSIRPTKDGGFVAAGDARGCGWIVKLTAGGDVAWQRTVCSRGNRSFASIELLDDGGFIAAGTARPLEADRDVWVVRLDAMANVRWQLFVRGDSDDQGRRIFATKEGFVVAASTDSFGAGESDVWLLGVSPAGALLWERTFGTTGPDAFRLVAGLLDGGVVVALRAQDVPKDFRLVRVDGAGAAPSCANIVVQGTDATLYEAPVSTLPVADLVTTGTLALGVVDAAPTLSRPYPTSTEVLCAAAETAPPRATRTRKVLTIDELFGRDPLPLGVDPAALLAERKFGELDALAARLLTSRELNRDGDWKLTLFHQLVGPRVDPIGGEFEEWRRLVEAWIAVSKQPTIPRTVLAAAYRDRAWHHRGGGGSGSVTEAAWEKYRKEIAASLKVLEGIASSPDPHYYDLRLTLAAETGGNFMVWFDRGVKVAPGFPDIWLSAISFLRPQWGGSVDEAAVFAARAPDDILYARMARFYIENSSGGEAQDAALKTFSWARVVRGMRALARQRPGAAFYLHQFAKLARRAGDRETAAWLFDQPALRWVPAVGGIWERGAWEQARTWAKPSLAPAPAVAAAPPRKTGPAPKPGVVRSTPTPPTRTAPAAPSVTSKPAPAAAPPVRKWTQVMVMENEVSVPGVASPDRLNSFFIRHKGATYAVSATCWAEKQNYEVTGQSGPVVVERSLRSWTMHRPMANGNKGTVTGVAMKTAFTPGQYAPAGILLRVDRQPDVVVLEPRLTRVTSSEPLWVIGASYGSQSSFSARLTAMNTGRGKSFGTSTLYIPEPPDDGIPGGLLIDADGKAVGVLVGPCRGDLLVAEDIGLLLERAR